MPAQTPAIRRRSGSRRIVGGLEAADSITAILADQPLRVRPLARSVAPATAQATGARAAKPNEITFWASSRTSTPITITPIPATSGASCALASIGGLAAGVELPVEVEVVIAVAEATRREIAVADAEPSHAHVGVEHDARVAALGGRLVGPVHVHAAVRVVERVHHAHADLRLRGHADVVRHEYHRFAHAQPQLERMVASRQLGVA